MIICNINVEDSLVNEACGILKQVTVNEQTDEFKILWLFFGSNKALRIT